MSNVRGSTRETEKGGKYFTKEQLENERERARENRRQISDERRRRERETTRGNRRRINEDEREGGEGE